MNKKEITIIEESLFMLNVNIGLIYVIILHCNDLYYIFKYLLCVILIFILILLINLIL